MATKMLEINSGISPLTRVADAVGTDVAEVDADDTVAGELVVSADDEVEPSEVEADEEVEAGEAVVLAEEATAVEDVAGAAVVVMAGDAVVDVDVAVVVSTRPPVRVGTA